ncbi:MAG TPA: hypothetical protein VFH48_24050 [Chloroflexota bacterium]|nr:hypothetical protein [Chloroflexota bacterium]
MVGARGPALAQTGVRCVALLLLLTCLVDVTISPSSTALASVCAGDEQILLAPTAPHVGSSLMVAAISGFPHDNVLLLGPNGPIPVMRVAIGERFVWQEIVVVDRPGANLFVFGVAGGAVPVTTCADASILVAEVSASTLGDLLNPYGQRAVNGTGPSQPSLPSSASGQPGETEALADPEGDDLEPADSEESSDGPQPAPRRRPTRTPTPRPDNENENGNDNEPGATKTPTRTPTSTRVPTSMREPTSTRVPTATRTPRPPATDTPVPTPTRTPRPPATDTPEPTPTLGPPSLENPPRVTCGQGFTFRGERLGNSRSAVDGVVRIDGREASITDWRMTQIQGIVPLNVRAGPDRELEVVVNGHSVRRPIPISC